MVVALSITLRAASTLTAGTQPVSPSISTPPRFKGTLKLEVLDSVASLQGI